MSKLHAQLCQVLDEMGVAYNTEEAVGPYSLDCYAPEYNVGFEADGPHHRMRAGRDQRRDAWILAERGIRILRLTTEDLSNKQRRAMTMIRIRLFLDGTEDR